MDRFLRRTGLEDLTPVEGYEKTEKLVKRLEREGYVVKVKESAGNGEEDVFWVVGPRGKVEVGEKGVKGLVRAVYDPAEGEEEGELESRVKRSLGIAEGEGREQPTEGRKKRGRKKEADEEGEDDEDDEDDE
jgi:hypothetical protein